MTASKLTNQEKEEIKRLLSSGARRKDLAKQFNVSPQSISRATVGVEKVFEHRGKHNNVKFHNPFHTSGLSHKEDYEI